MPGARKLLLNEKGSALVGALIAGAIVVAVTAAVVQQQAARKSAHKAQLARPISLAIRDRLLALVNQKETWEIMRVKNAEAFAKVEKYPGGRAPTIFDAPLLDVYLSDSPTPYYRSTDDHAGFDFSGRPCVDATRGGNGNEAKIEDCPFYFKIRLKSRYLVDSKWVEQLRFDIDYRSGRNLAAFNADSREFHFDFVRGGSAENGSASLCVSSGGSFDYEANKCSLALSQTTTCAANQVYQGPSAQGSVGTCAETKASATCSSTQAVIDLDDAGNPVCGDIPPSGT